MNSRKYLEMFMNSTKIMNAENCKKIKSWGIGEGRLPITTDPENLFKPFAEYEQEDKPKEEKK